MQIARRKNETQTEQQLREHYLIERELADRLRNAPRWQRHALYSQLYDELFRRAPHHPMLQARDPAQRQHEIISPVKLLERFLSHGSVFMEVGAGDCVLATHAASLVKRVYAIDVSEETRDVARPDNFELILSDGCNMPVPKGSIDVAFSNQLMEHLHPQDAIEQLDNIYRSLAPGGVYVCITPNRLFGPCDISRHFDETATGFHLREYCARDIRRLFADAGFTDMRFYVGGRGRFLRCPYRALAVLESMLETLPHSLRRRVADTAPMRALLGLYVAAFTPCHVASA